MGKYIIEVDESEIVECWNEQAAKELGYQEYALKKCPKIKVKPYNSSGDPVSREAVKNYARKVMYEQNATNFSLLKMFDEIIDNAPPAPERPQGECCGSCYLCDVGDCGADMRKGSTE